METYNDILKIGIGRVVASVSSDNYFPVVGEIIKLSATTKWAETSTWNTQTGNGTTNTIPGNIVDQKDSIQITIANKGELKQKFIGSNHKSNTEAIKSIYAMEKQTLPYFTLTATEVVRVKDTGRIDLTFDNGYDRDATAVLKIFTERSFDNPVKTLNFTKVIGQNKMYVEFQFTERSDRGIYDIEVDVTDTLSNQTLSQRHEKLVTVTPQLCPKPSNTTTGFEVASTYKGETSYAGTKEFQIKLWRNVNNTGLNYAEAIIPRGNESTARYNDMDLSSLPAGTTLVLKYDKDEPQNYPKRLFITGNKNHNLTSENGTPNLTYESPLVITHDFEDKMLWEWIMYGAIQTTWNLRNIVIDGYGYHNTGIEMRIFPGATFVDSAIYIVNGSSNFELFGIDVKDSGFAGITAKTDPNPNMPWFWRASGWELKDLRIHHCQFRNTGGEGCYIGYFDTAPLKKQNSQGVDVTYQAHLVTGLRLYRSLFYENGYDSVQINNAQDVEFCYNVLDGCGYRREPNQGSAFSCTMDGRIYNCIVKNNYNGIGVFGPYLKGLEVFNSVLTAAKLTAGWYLIRWSNDQNPQTVISNLFYSIHNNVVKANRIGILTGDVQFENYTMNDNIFITEIGDTTLPGYFVGSGNVFVKADEEYAYIDSELKVADSINYNYQPNYNSKVVTSGLNGISAFDARGYKNWYIGNFHSGPYMGIYKDTTIQDDDLSLSNIVINNGDAYTYDSTVSVKINYLGNPTRYRLSEYADFNDVQWKPISELTEGAAEFVLSSSFGNKTIYCQVDNSNQTSKTVNSSIEYRRTPIAIQLKINDGAAYTVVDTVSVKATITGTYTSLEYMLSEDNTFQNTSYQPYISGTPIAHTFTDKGVKTLYFRVKSDSGEIADANATIQYISKKCMISFVNYPINKRGLDAETGITRPWNWPINSDIYDISGAVFGKIQCLNSTWPTLSQGANPKYVATGTGNNSGVYPDIYLALGLCKVVELRNLTEADNIKITNLEQGTYTVKILSNGYARWGKMATTIIAHLFINGQDHIFADLGVEQFKDNHSQVATIDNIVVGEDRTITIAVAVNDGNNDTAIPINIIEIEKKN